MPFDGFERLGKEPPAVGVDLADDLLQRGFGFARDLEIVPSQRLEAGLKLVGLVERIEIHIADIDQLAPQVGDFLFDGRSLNAVRRTWDALNSSSSMP